MDAGAFADHLRAAHPRVAKASSRPQILAAILTVLICAYLLGPQVRLTSDGAIRIDFAAVGIRLFEFDRPNNVLRGFGVADLHEPVNAEEYVGIATILLAIATVVLALQTRGLVSDSKRHLSYLASQTASLNSSLRLSADTVAEMRAREVRRSIVELREHVHTVSVAAIQLDSAFGAIANVGARYSSSPPDVRPAVDNVMEEQRASAVKTMHSTCQPIYARLLALVDDLPFVDDVLREDVNAGLVTLAFIRSEATASDVKLAVDAWWSVRNRLLEALDAFQGRSRRWKTRESFT